MAEIANLVVKYSADTANAEAGAERVNSGLSKMGKTAALIGAAAGVAVGGFLAKSIGAAANFEQAMDGVAASLGGVGTAGGITEAQFAAMNEEALRIGQTTSVGATDAARAMDLLAKAGVDTEAIINGTAQAVINVSEATGESVAQSASSLGSLSNLFAATGISGSEMADVIVNAMNSSDATLSEFQTGIANLAPVIAGTGMEFDEAAGLISYFNSQGMAAAKVGSSLNSMYMNLVNPTNDMVAAQQALGIAVYDTNGQFVGIPEVLDQVRTATEGMTDAQRDAWITQLFGAEALDVVTMALEDQEGALEEHIDAMDEQGAAATAAATRMDNLKGDIEQLRGAIETASIRIGSAFIPALRNIVQGVTSGIEAVMDFGESMGELMDNGLNPVAAAFAVLQDRLFQMSGGGGVLGTISDAFVQLTIFAIDMGEAVEDVVDAFQDLVRGDFAGAWREVTEAANTAFDAISNIGSIAIDWVMNVGVPSFVSTVADLAGQARDWIKGQIEGESGLLVDIAQVAINILDAVANLTMADVTGAIQKEIDSLMEGVSFLVGGVKLIIGAIAGENVSATGDIPGAIQTFIDNTKKEFNKLIDIVVAANVRFGGVSFGGGGGGGGGTSGGPIGNPTIQRLIDGFLPRSVQRELAVILSYKLTNLPGDLGRLKDRAIRDIKGALGTLQVSDIPWALRMADPRVTVPALIDTIKEAIPDISISGIKWALGLAIPDINLPSGDAIKAAIRVAGEAAGIPGWVLDRIVGGASPTPAMDWGAPFGNAGPSVPPASDRGVNVGGQMVTTLPNVGSGSTAGAAGVLAQVRQIGQQITQIMAQIANAIRSGAQQAVAALTPLGNGFRTMATQVQAATTQMATMVRTQFTMMQAAVNASVMQLSTMVRTQFMTLTVAVNTSVTQMATMVRTQFTALQAATSATVTAMAAQIRAQFTSLQASVTASANQMRATVQSAMQAMASAGASAMNQFASAVRSGFQQAAAAAQAGVAAIRGAVNSIGSLYGQGFSIGASFGQGVAAGLYSMLGAVQAAAAAIVAAAASAAAAAAMIGSPSRLMRDEIGVPLGQGVAVGIESQRRNVADTFASLIPGGGRTGRGVTFAGAGAYAGRSGSDRPVQHVTIVTLEPGKWQEFLRKADNGNRAYQQQQPRSREIALGTSRG